MTNQIEGARVSTSEIRGLRELTGAGVMECRNALVEANGDKEKAALLLKQKGLARAKEKANRATTQGLVEAYVHTGGRVGAMVEVNCETDFAAHTEVFKELAHDLAMQVAAMAPKTVSAENMPEGAISIPREDCLLLQPFIKDNSKTVEAIITEAAAKVGENVKVKRFARYELGG